MAKQVLNITINLANLRGELHRSLQKAIYLVCAGLQSSKEQINPESLRLPTKSITLIVDGGLRWDAEEVQKQYIEWVLSNGFRDVIEAVSAFLESAHQVLSFWGILGKQKDGAEISASDYNDIIISGNRKFHRFGLPEKFTHLKTEHDIDVEPKFSIQILSVNTARNCLVHRGGIVKDRDINNNNALEVNWTKVMVVVKNENGEKELVLGEMIEKGNVLAMRSQEDLKVFHLGERVVFTAEEFANISWSLLLFGNHLVQKINDFGLKNGFVKESKESA